MFLAIAGFGFQDAPSSHVLITWSLLDSWTRIIINLFHQFCSVDIWFGYKMVSADGARSFASSWILLISAVSYDCTSVRIIKGFDGGGSRRLEMNILWFCFWVQRRNQIAAVSWLQVFPALFLFWSCRMWCEWGLSKVPLSSTPCATLNRGWRKVNQL